MRSSDPLVEELIRVFACLSINRHWHPASAVSVLLIDARTVEPLPVSYASTLVETNGDANKQVQTTLLEENEREGSVSIDKSNSGSGVEYLTKRATPLSDEVRPSQPALCAGRKSIRPLASAAATLVSSLSPSSDAQGERIMYDPEESTNMPETALEIVAPDRHPDPGPIHVESPIVSGDVCERMAVPSSSSPPADRESANLVFNSTPIAIPGGDVKLPSSMLPLRPRGCRGSGSKKRRGNLNQENQKQR